MTVSINGTNGITFFDASTQNTAATGFGFKNRIINGAMMIDQRNAGASVALVNTANTYTVDRFFGFASQTSKLTAQQNAGSVTPPTGYVNYLGATSSATFTSGAAEYFYLGQFIEGLNCADLGWGAAGASTVTLSFWVRSSLVGTFSGALGNGAADRSYAFTFTVNAANTWEQKTVTIAGDTSGTWLKTNSAGIRLYFDLGSGTSNRTTAGSWASGFYIGATGTNSLGSASGATFYITGVQLEKGSTATSFDVRPYGTELALCQRYFYKSYNQTTVPGTASVQPSNTAWVVDTATLTRVFFASGSKFAVTMRVYPTTVTYYSEDGTANSVSVYSNPATKLTISTTPNPTESNLSEYLQLSSNATAGTPYVFSFTASAEL